jgi:hypothetical protein
LPRDKTLCISLLLDKKVIGIAKRLLDKISGCFSYHTSEFHYGQVNGLEKILGTIEKLEHLTNLS